MHKRLDDLQESSVPMSCAAASIEGDLAEAATSGSLTFSSPSFTGTEAKKLAA